MVVPLGTRHVYSQQAETPDHITIHYCVHCCVSASAEALPPMIIFEMLSIWSVHTQGGPENTLYAKSPNGHPNGYMDLELYCLWFELIFLKYASSERPLLLIQDGHKSHITIELIDKAKENDVEIMCLSPHTTNAYIAAPGQGFVWPPEEGMVVCHYSIGTC